MVRDADAPNGHHIELVGELGGIQAGDAETTKPARFARVIDYANGTSPKKIAMALNAEQSRS